jgi:hypothetical protein
MDRGERAHQPGLVSGEKLPPLGVRLTVDVEAVSRVKGTVYKARVRWTHPVTHHREGTRRVFDSRGEADAWLRRMQTTADTGVDPGQTLSDYCTHIGNRWTRGIDPTSTYAPTRPGCASASCPPSDSYRSD